MSAQIEVVLVRDGDVIHEHRVNGRPVLIGRSMGSDLRLPSDALRALLWTEDGNLWIRDLDSEAGVYVGGRRLMRPTAVSLTESVRLGADIELKVRQSVPTEPVRYPYRLVVSLQGTTGPEASIEDLSTGQRCVLRSNNRVSMLYLLARQLERDAKQDLPVAQRGWCSDEEIACGVWGRHWQRQIKSHLYVLVHRVRKEMKEAGFDPQCIEKKRRHSRAWIQEAVLC